MQIEKIIYREDEIIFKLKEGNNKYAMKLNWIKDLPDRETVDKWCKYIKENFDGKEEEKLDEDLLFYANWIEGEDKKYFQNIS